MELTDGKNGDEDGARDDARNELATCCCAANERHDLSSVALLPLPVISTVLPSPLAPAVSSWALVDLICKLLNLGIHKRVMLWQWYVCRVSVVCLFWRSDLLL